MTTADYLPICDDPLFGVLAAGSDADQDGAAEGERRRDAAHDLLRDRRAVYVRRAQRALLSAALDAGTATADDVAAAVELPPDVDGRLLGAAPGALARAGLLALRGYVHSGRPTRHASIQAVWGLADRAGALAWLDAHPDLPDVDLDAERRQLTLTFDERTPTVAAAGVRVF
jgi:hypothetical protein